MNPFWRQPASAVQDTWFEKKWVTTCHNHLETSRVYHLLILKWIKMAAYQLSTTYGSIKMISVWFGRWCSNPWDCFMDFFMLNSSLSVRVDLPHSISKDRAKNLSSKDVRMTLSTLVVNHGPNHPNRINDKLLASGLRMPKPTYYPNWNWNNWKLNDLNKSLHTGRLESPLIQVSFAYLRMWPRCPRTDLGREWWWWLW